MKAQLMSRRHIFGVSAALGAAVALPRFAFAETLEAKNIKARTTGPVELLYKAPHYGSNGIWISDEGMWIIHQIPKSYATLINIQSGSPIREIQCEGVLSASGICIDENGLMWIGSTYNRLIVACDQKTGKALAKYSTPGAGQIYSMAGDVEGHRTPLEPAYPAPVRSDGGGGRGAGKQDLDITEGPAGTGAHCPLPRGDLLFVDVPPARRIFAINKETWQVQHSFPTAGNRPHDMSWADASKTHLWCADSNMNAFFLHNADNGAIEDRVNLPEGSPIIHGAKMHNGYMYMCDDVGWVSRVKI
jgi:hypothetical protein